MTGGEQPIGRRLAQWRVRRRMTQQMLADRLGKSKSWVDKVERGVRTLDKLSVIEDIARVLRVDPVVLLGREALPPEVAAGADGVDAVRAALTQHDVFRRGTGGTPPPDQLARQVEYAWLTYQHARYPQLLRALPDLISAARRAHADRPDRFAELLVQGYRVTSAVLVKLGEADLAWLVADRAVAAALDDPVLAATAAVPLGQALRALGRGRLAMAATVTAAHRIAPPTPHEGPPQESSLCGTLLLQAALAAATCGDARSVGELTDQAAEMAERVGEHGEHHWIGFGPTVVELARVVAAVELGEAGAAVDRHEQITRRAQWARLPPEHRAAHLVDAARAYLLVGDLPGAGRALVEADRTAPAETRTRPAARTVIAEVYRDGPVPAALAHLATAVGLTR